MSHAFGARPQPISHEELKEAAAREGWKDLHLFKRLISVYDRAVLEAAAREAQRNRNQS